MKSLIKYLTVLSLLTCSAFANFLVVTSDQVSATSESLFVMIEGASIPVESVNTANAGYMVAIPLPTPMADICPQCGRDTYTKGRFCRSCGFPDDGKRSLNANALR
jgi:hypothetical protein